jgi:hypothetical protein
MPIRPALFAGLLAAAMALLPTAPVSAKIPYFSVELEPRGPVAGEPITVIVRFWDDAAHTQPATWGPHGSVDDLLTFVRADGAASESVVVPLEPVGADAMRGTVTLPSGRWTLTAWEKAPEAPPAGYPDPLAVEVSAPDTATPFAATSASAVALLIALAVMARRGRRSRQIPLPGELGDELARPAGRWTQR